MSRREINLIISKKGLTREEKRVRGLVIGLTSVVILIFCIISGLVFFASYSLNNQMQSIAATTESLKSQVEKKQNIEVIYRILKQKSLSVKNLVNAKAEYSEIYAYFRNLESTGITIDSLELVSGGKILLRMKAPSAAVVDAFSAALLADAPKKYGRIEIVGLTELAGGDYQITLEITSI